MLKREELLRMFESAGAIRHGHFELSSGLHSGTYVQCAQVLQYPRFAEKLGQALAALFSDATIEAVVSPAIGGMVDHFGFPSVCVTVSALPLVGAWILRISTK